MNHLHCLLPGLVAATITAVEPAPPISVTPPDLPTVYRSVSLDDGVDAAEAQRLANAYALIHLSGCGGVPEVVDAGATWTAVPHLGFDARPGPTIIIDKVKGVISCAGGPLIVPPGVPQVILPPPLPATAPSATE